MQGATNFLLRAPGTTPVGTVYRGDGRAVAEIFENGITARNPAMSIEEHLAGGIDVT